MRATGGRFSMLPVSWRRTEPSQLMKVTSSSNSPLATSNEPEKGWDASTGRTNSFPSARPETSTHTAASRVNWNVPAWSSLPMKGTPLRITETFFTSNSRHANVCTAILLLDRDEWQLTLHGRHDVNSTRHPRGALCELHPAERTG